MPPLDKKYELATDRVPALTWEEYVNIASVELRLLLDEKPNDEDVFHRFFERNPAFMPGGYDTDDGSGHSPFPLSLITKPKLAGTFHRTPDFMWIASYTGVLIPVLIEIEAPIKKCFTTGAVARSEFSQALKQLHEWKLWMDDPANQQIFVKRFITDEGFRFHVGRERSFKPKYLLVYGRRAELSPRQNLAKLRDEHANQAESIRTYDGLFTPSCKCKDAFTVKFTEKGYEAVEVSPSLQIWPMHAEWYAHISKKEEAIMRNTLMAQARKEFLVRRFRYWDDWIRDPKNKSGLFDGHDYE